MLKKKIHLLILFLFLTSCGGTFDSVKKGLTGKKDNSIDEFLVEKKDPLILPPDYEDLPLPGTSQKLEEEISIFEDTSSSKNTNSAKGSTEQSILEKIRNR